MLGLTYIFYSFDVIVLIIFELIIKLAWYIYLTLQIVTFDFILKLFSNRNSKRWSDLN